jgi:hypothetical protein
VIENDPNIKQKILREAGKRRDKRLRIALNEDEYAILLGLSIQEDVTMADIIRRKVFKDV